MKPWVPIALVILMPGGWILALAWWLRRRWVRRSAQHADTLIRPPIWRFRRSDDTLRVKTEQRRKAADGIRQRAVHIESGATAADVLKLVRRG